MNHSATFSFRAFIYFSQTRISREVLQGWTREKVLSGNAFPSFQLTSCTWSLIRENPYNWERSHKRPRGWLNKREPSRLAHLRNTRGFSLKSHISLLNMASFSLCAWKEQANIPLSMTLRHGAPCPLPCRCPIPIKREREGAIEYNLWTYIGY